MHQSLLVAAAIAGCMAFLGCDSSAGSSGAEPAAETAKPGSCQAGGPTGGTCSDYTAEGAKGGKLFCEKTGGGKNVWSDKPCRTEGRVGTCARKRGQTQHYYKGGTLSAAQAKNMCTTMSEGTWTDAAAVGSASAKPSAAAKPSASAAAK